MLREVVIPFNGEVVTRELVERIGLSAGGVLHRGDDVEYLWRAHRAGRAVATVVARSCATRPSTTSAADDVRPDAYNDTPTDLKHYCMVRNNTINLREYSGWPTC